jgi:hypothetical protein
LTPPNVSPILHGYADAVEVSLGNSGRSLIVGNLGGEGSIGLGVNEAINQRNQGLATKHTGGWTTMALGDLLNSPELEFKVIWHVLPQLGWG